MSLYPHTRRVLEVLAGGEDLHELHPQWIEISGGIGRLSDHIHHIRRYLRRYQPHLHVLAERRYLKVGDRHAICAAYHLEKSERVSPQLQLSL